jgi:hypothetical protein
VGADVISRRGFLFGAAGAGVLTAAGAAPLASEGTVRSWIAATVADHLAEGGLTGTGVETFAADYLARRPVTLAMRAAAHPLFGWAAELLPSHARAVADIRRSAITEYLVHSDLFDRRPERGGTVAYLGASERMCVTANPFARFLDEAA